MLFQLYTISNKKGKKIRIWKKESFGVNFGIN